MKVIARIEDPDVIQKILTHLQLNTRATAPGPLVPTKNSIRYWLPPLYHQRIARYVTSRASVIHCSRDTRT
jgi:hypothetical protein